MACLIRLDKTLISPYGQEALDFFNATIIGQDRAKMAFVNILEKVKADYRPQNAPLEVAILVGPQGVGKTELVRRCAQFINGDYDGLVLVEGSNYQHDHQVSTIVGAPPGYIGQGQEILIPQSRLDALSKKSSGNKKIVGARKIMAEKRDELKAIHRKILGIVRSDFLADRSYPNSKSEKMLKGLCQEEAEQMESLRNINKWLKKLESEEPSSLPAVVCLDEIDKFHPDITQAFLNIMGSGYMTTSNDNSVIDFRNVILVMTSNLGAKEARDYKRGKKSRIGLGSPGESQKSDKSFGMYQIYKAKMEERFSPEFMSRLNNIISFTSLSVEQIGQIFDLQLADLHERFWDKDGIGLVVAPEVKDFVVAHATKRDSGDARVLKDKIKKYLVDPMAKFKNLGEFAETRTIIAKLNEDKDGKKFVEFFKEQEQ